LDSLSEKYPKKVQLAQEIIDLLCLEREAVYRRLRKDVIFPFHEIAKICSAWNLSLDEIIGIDSGKIIFQMRPINYLDPSKKEMSLLKKRVKTLENILKCANTEFMEVSNSIPRPLCTSFMPLYRYEVFRWAYQYNTDDAYKQYGNIIIPEMVSKEFENYNKLVKNISNTHFLLDPMVFDYLVNNIQYFHSVLVISDKEKELLKESLFSLLDYMLEIANNGCYPETQKKVNLYISQLNIDTNYSYFYTENLNSCRVHAFGKFDICSFDLDMVTKFRTWMHIKKRASVQISETNERKRIEFFSKQKKLVDSL
jgi:hypothetical protein